jgi:hypothetical protein
MAHDRPRVEFVSESEVFIVLMRRGAIKVHSRASASTELSCKWANKDTRLHFRRQSEVAERATKGKGHAPTQRRTLIHAPGKTLVFVYYVQV